MCLQFACSGESSVPKEEVKPVAAEQSGETFKRKETLYVGGWDWAPPTTFNRLAPDPNWPVDGAVQVMYEALFGYDQMTSELVPHLATSYEQLDGAIEVTLDNRARWSDGTAVTAEDVLYTFYLDKRYPTARHGMWKYLTDIRVTQTGKIRFELDPEERNPLYVLDYLSENVILPKAVWEQVEKKSAWSEEDKKADYMTLLKFTNDKDPVVSGPYNLHSYSDQKIVLVRRDDYWGNVKHAGKKPAPKYIIHTLDNSNANFTQAMVKGNLDVGSHFIPRIWNKRKDKIRAWSDKPPYHVPGSIPALMVALWKPPFNDVAFRQALARAINYERINTLAVSSYSPPLKPGFILPFGPEEKYYFEQDGEKIGYGFDLDKAKGILRAAGYATDSSGRLHGKDGAPMREITIECPRGWSDWENTVRVVVGNLKKLGIPAKESLVDYVVWKQNLGKGAFDLSMEAPTPILWPSTPWRRFAQVMSNQNLRPPPETVYENYGRYSDPETEAILTRLPRLEDEKESIEAYRALNLKFMQDLPVLPLMYRPTEFYQFSEKHWTGFPSEKNPTSPPQCLLIGAGVSGLWALTPASQGTP